MKINNCKACKSKKIKNEIQHLKLSGRGIKENKVVAINISSCEECGFKFQNEPISEKLINELYSKHYTGSWLQQWMRYIGEKRIRKNSALSFSFFLDHKPNASVLEVGSSSGYNLKNIAKKYKNASLKGIDLDERAVHFGKKRGINLSTENLFDIKEKYDVIFLNHVFEHINDIDGFLKGLLSKLNENGILVINVPNSPFWDEAPSWEHINYFSSESLKKFFKRHNLIFSMSTHIINRIEHFVPEIRVIISPGNTKIIQIKDTVTKKDQIKLQKKYFANGNKT